MLEVASCCLHQSFQGKALFCLRRSVCPCPLICHCTSVAEPSTSQEKKHRVSAVDQSTRAGKFPVVRTSRTVIQRRDQASCCRLRSLSQSLPLWCFRRESVLPPSSHCLVIQVVQEKLLSKTEFCCNHILIGKATSDCSIAIWC